MPGGGLIALIEYAIIDSYFEMFYEKENNRYICNDIEKCIKNIIKENIKNIEGQKKLKKLKKNPEENQPIEDADGYYDIIFSFSSLFKEYIKSDKSCHRHLFDRICDLFFKYSLKIDIKRSEIMFYCKKCNSKIPFNHLIKKLEKNDFDYCKKCTSIENIVIEI
jgi:hypothetical protein